MGKLIDITGQTFSRLKVLSVYTKDGNGIAICECVCGNTVHALSRNLRRGLTRSCGCLHKDIVTKHGAKTKSGRHPLYSIWSGMHQRCYDKNSKDYKNYGGRGIIVCDEWHEYEPFRDYMILLPNCPLSAQTPNTSLERSIDRYPDKNGNYEPGNVRWSTALEQNTNKRTTRDVTINGVTMDLKSAALKYGKVSYVSIINRLNKGWSTKSAFLTPARKDAV